MAGKYDSDVLRHMAQEVLGAYDRADGLAGDLVFQVALKTGLPQQDVMDQIRLLASNTHREQHQS